MKKRIVRQVGYLQRLYRDAVRSTEHKILIFFLIHGFVHHDSMLIKRSNLMQQCADIYLLQSHSTCFGRHSTHHQEY